MESAGNPIRIPQENKKRDLFKLFAGIALGFSFFEATSNNKSPVNKKFHEKKIRNLEYFPRVEILGKKGTYHFHHWIIFATLYLPLLLRKSSVKSKFLRGFLLGSILQGLTYKDRFKIKYKSSRLDSTNILKRS